MPGENRPTTVRGIDYASTFRFTEIFRCFAIAIRPGNLLLGLLLVVAMFVASLVLDGLFGGASVVPGEFDAFIEADSTEAFDDWRQQKREGVTAQLTAMLQQIGSERAEEIATGRHRFNEVGRAIDQYFQGRLEPLAADSDARDTLRAEWQAQRNRLENLRPVGVFQTVLNEKLSAVGAMMDSITGLRFGWHQFSPAEPLDRQTVFGAIRTLWFELPAWLWHGHATFMVVWLIVFIALWSWFGGAVSRMCIADAATNERIGAFEAMTFARRRWRTYMLTPVLPPLIVGGLSLLLAGVGLLYHVPGLNVVAAVLYTLAIGVGFIMAFLLILWLGAVHLMYPTISAEGCDALDALSRSYNMVIGRPWRFISYTLIALVYGALTYLFVGMFVYLSLWLAQGATALWVSGFDAIVPPPELGQLRYRPDVAELGPTERVAAAVIRVWVYLTIGLVAAYAISYYFAAYSTIYLLLRRRTEGVSMTEFFRDPAHPAPPANEKIEPGSKPDPNEPTPLTQADSE